MEFETALNLFLTFVNIVAVWAVGFSTEKHASAMSAHREYLEKQNAATDDEIKAIDPDGLAEGFARAIESAVLEKLKAQEPVAFTNSAQLGYVKDGMHPDIPLAMWATNTTYSGANIKLYTHPLPPADVVQKYGELLYEVQRKFPDETRHQTALRYIKTAESPSYTNAAMKEMK